MRQRGAAATMDPARPPLRRPSVFSTPSSTPGNITLHIDPGAARAATAGPAAWQMPPRAPTAPRSPAQEIPPALWQDLARHGVLRPLLRQRLIATTVAPLTLSEPERLEAQRAWAERHGLSTPETLEAHLSRHGLREADLHWQAELPLRIERFAETRFGPEAESHFLSRRPALDQLTYSLLRVGEESLAGELYLRLVEEAADFAELVVRFGCDPERASLGRVGPLPRDQVDPRLVELLSSSCVGSWQGPLCLDSWWLVLRLESFQPASFDEEPTRRRMERELFEAWLEQEVDQLVRQHGLPEPAGEPPPPAIPS